MAEGTDRYTADQLNPIAERLLMGAGVPGDIAETVASLLVWSERIGHASPSTWTGSGAEASSRGLVRSCRRENTR